MSRDAREQAQLEDIADTTYNMYQYFKELTEYERGEYDALHEPCLLYTSPSPRDGLLSRMPSSA